MPHRLPLIVYCYLVATYSLPTRHVLATYSLPNCYSTRYRTASHWSSFVPRMLELIRQADGDEDGDEAVLGGEAGLGGEAAGALRSGAATADDGGVALGASTATATSTTAAATSSAAAATSMVTATSSTASATPSSSPPRLRFYLAADSAEAYEQLTSRFGARVVRAPRRCDAGAARCDYRDCDALIEAMVDLLNLAHCGRLLGSGWSSYTEVAARWGGGGSGAESGGDDDGDGSGNDDDGDEYIPLERAGIDFARPLGIGIGGGSEMGWAPAEKRCTCLEPGNPRPSRNGYACRTADGAEAGATTFCPLRQACVPDAEWPWLGPKERPCAMWDGLEWEYNAKHTPKTNVWAAAPITREAPPIEGTARLPIVGLARLRHLTAAAGARLRRAQTRF